MRGGPEWRLGTGVVAADVKKKTGGHLVASLQLTRLPLMSIVGVAVIHCPPGGVPHECH